MADEEYVEPSNEQLANFLIVYASYLPGAAGLELDARTLKEMMDRRPEFREGALRHHRGFQAEINELTRKMKAGELGCEHIRGNGKKCPNRNEPGSFYCGLHKDQHEGED